MIPSWAKKLQTLFAIAALGLASLMASGQNPAEAGGKKQFFRGPPGAFNNNQHGGNAYNTTNPKAKVNTRARARARARRRALAAKNKKARAAAKARATESNSTAVPSTAALLTKKDLDVEARTPNKRSPPDDKVTVATTSDDSKPDTSSSAASIGEGGCKKFVPAVGIAVSVSCD